MLFSHKAMIFFRKYVVLLLSLRVKLCKQNRPQSYHYGSE